MLHYNFNNSTYVSHLNRYQNKMVVQVKHLTVRQI